MAGRTLLWLLAIILLLMGSNGCSDVTGSLDQPTTDDIVNVPSDFPAIQTPQDNPISAEKADLGRSLFYDTRLSLDRSVSCGSCHHQEFAFSDGGNAVSRGFDGHTGLRNARSLTNVAYNTAFFWDGGVPTLEVQALAPILHPDEMNMNTDTLVARLETDQRYREMFQRAWGTPEITIERITKSIATFERRLISSDSPFDRWNRGDSGAMSAAAVRGYQLFFGEQGDCFHCHGSFNFTDNGFHNDGIDSTTGDPGRFRITNRVLDNGKFMTPTLRNVAVTGPYMHDGRFSSLEEVVHHYNRGGTGDSNQDPVVRPLHLSDNEIADLVAFLNALTDATFLSDTSLSNPWN